MTFDQFQDIALIISLALVAGVAVYGETTK